MVEDVFGLIGTVQAGTFRVEQAVAEGGFGVVYRAHHTAFRAPVALKCLKVPRSLSAADSVKMAVVSPTSSRFGGANRTEVSE